VRKKEGPDLEPSIPSYRIAPLGGLTESPSAQFAHMAMILSDDLSIGAPGAIDLGSSF
jgi:hypothetical protein